MEFHHTEAVIAAVTYLQCYVVTKLNETRIDFVTVVLEPFLYLLDFNNLHLGLALVVIH